MTRTLARKLACPTPRKRYYTSQLRACVVLAKILAHPETVIPGVRPPCRAYHCRCGFWHLTSRTYNAADESTTAAMQAEIQRTNSLRQLAQAACSPPPQWMRRAAADELARLTDEMGLYRTDQEAS